MYDHSSHIREWHLYQAMLAKFPGLKTFCMVTVNLTQCYLYGVSVD